MFVLILKKKTKRTKIKLVVKFVAHNKMKFEICMFAEIAYFNVS